MCEGQAGAGHWLRVCSRESWFFVRSPELGGLGVLTDVFILSVSPSMLMVGDRNSPSSSWGLRGPLKQA